MKVYEVCKFDHNGRSLTNEQVLVICATVKRAEDYIRELNPSNFIKSFDTIRSDLITESVLGINRRVQIKLYHHPAKLTSIIFTIKECEVIE